MWFYIAMTLLAIVLVVLVGVAIISTAISFVVHLFSAMFGGTSGKSSK